MAGVALKIVLVYSDQSSASLGAEVTSALRQKLGNDFHVAQSNWKTEMLKHAGLRLIAAEEARDSDIVILAVSESGPLDPNLKGWFKLWEQRERETPGALVALLNQSEERTETESLKRQLEQFAKRAHMEFFCHRSAATVPSDPVFFARNEWRSCPPILSM